VNPQLTLLFPNHVAIEITDLVSASASLLPEEELFSQHYSAKRRREFITGRTNARQLLKKYNLHRYPLLPNADRAPIWPEGIIGSISHCKDLCGVIVSEAKHYRSIGFDIENIRTFNFAVRKYICTEDEDEWLLSLPEASRSQALLLIFSIKESLYKCIYQADGIKLNFKKISSIPQFEHGRFLLSPVDDLHMKYKDIKTRFIITEQHIYSLAHYLK